DARPHPLTTPDECPRHAPDQASRRQEPRMNPRSIGAIYRFEMARTWRTLLQSIVAPVISTSLYFIVFGTAIGSRIQQIGDVSYGAFIVPGLIMLSLLTH